MLKDQRKEADTANATAAMPFFNGNLDHLDTKNVFRYTKSGQSMLVAKESVIAGKWRHLLKTDDIIRERYLQLHR